MSLHRLEQSQVIHSTREFAWAFFSDPRNLEKITPASMDFHILSSLPEKVYPGLLIEYRVRPLLGIPLRWVSEITHVDPLNYFVDEQRIGPYRLWHHEHFFEDADEGRVRVRDIVHYALPLGFLGDLIHTFLVQDQLRQIFSYREKALSKRFPTPTPTP